MAIEIRTAETSDVEVVAHLQVALFDEDGDVHDPTVDVDWPRRHGTADIAELIDGDGTTVLVARADDAAVGFLVGYVVASSPTRTTSKHAVLRSLYVAPSHRRSGAATGLVTAFVAWAAAIGCDEATVDHYAANEGAAAFYAARGFAARSISRVRPIGPDRS